MPITFQFGKSYSYVIPVGQDKVPVAVFKHKELLQLEEFLDLPSGVNLEFAGNQYVPLYGSECPVFIYKNKRIVLPPSAVEFLFRINTKVKKRM